jgi:DNA-nicking Smr family endonuclease
LPAPVGTLGPATPGLDRRTAERLRRGRTDPEARLDLHGRTLEAAHSELAAFIRRVHGQGMRVVLVITGKGRPQPEGWFARGGGALRENVPRWLGLPPLAALVVGVYPAHARHGGGGAFYVYLKRSGGGR